MIALYNLENKYKNLALEKVRKFYTDKGIEVCDYFPLNNDCSRINTDVEKVAREMIKEKITEVDGIAQPIQVFKWNMQTLKELLKRLGAGE